MSSWTEVLMTATALEDIGSSDAPGQYVAVDHINVWLRENGWWDMFLIQAPDPTQHCPYSCFAGHFKSLDHDGFIEAVKSAPWQWRENVQLFLRKEHDEQFHEVNLR